MSEDVNELTRLVAKMRRDFDRSFGLLAAPPQGEAAQILKIGLGEETYGVELREVRAIERLGRLQPLPGAIVNLLGVTGFRNTALAVFDLAAALGVRQSAKPHWLIVCQGSPLIGLAVGAVEGCARIGAARADDNPNGAAKDVVSRDKLAGEEAPLRMIDLPAVLARIRAGTQSAGGRTQLT